MIYVLDTDHLSLLGHKDSIEAPCIRRRILELPADDIVATTIVNFEEQMRGWMSAMKLAKNFQAEVGVYTRLLRNLEDFRDLTILPFDRNAACSADMLRAQKLRIGTMDLKIAAIALTSDAVVVTRNQTDFSKVPALRSEDWSRDD